MADQPDARELWAQGCLAKANYCEFALSLEVDGAYREWLQKLAAEWKRAAKEGPPAAKEGPPEDKSARSAQSASSSSTGSGASQSSHE